MIRINLLPFRAARAKENIRRQVSIFLLLIVLVLVGMWCHKRYFIDLKIDRLEADNKQVEAQIKDYKAKADEVTAIEKDLGILEQKLKVVYNLKSMLKDAVILLESMTRLVVKEQMWITYIQTSDTAVTLKGVAFDNRTVADFMTNLEKSSLFKSVDLNTLQMQDMQSVKVKIFEVVSSKALRETKENEQEEQSKKK
ncbi:MAG: PilN domain-containing protein [Desulfamplus sp.]|nr:PilN domain-containing protein [Desulfamplus sp.]MBF0413603.1 PilN domain-containing protein [Desulfamplus sp.]